MKQEPLLELRNLRYSYDGKVPTLDIAHFLLRPGEKVAVLGANGAGKSTFFLCLNGVLPAQGEILYRGTAITKIACRICLYRPATFLPCHHQAG